MQPPQQLSQPPFSGQALASRRRFVKVGVAGCAALAFPFVQAAPKLEKSRLVLAVEGKGGFQHLPLTVAEQLGYFRAEGLELEIIDLPAGRGHQAVLSGAADIAAGDYEVTILMQARNQMLQAFVLQGRTPPIAFGVSNRNLPGFKSVAELKGKKIGVSASGTATQLVASRVLARSGLQAGDVTFVGVGTSSNALAGLRSGQLDAISNLDPVMTMLEQKGEVKIVSDARTVKGTLDLFGGPMPAACLYAPLAFVQRHPNTCQALASGIVHGLKWLQTAGPGDIIKTVPEPYLLGDRALYLASFNKVRESIALDGMFPEDGGRTVLKALAQFDASVSVDKLSLGKTYTNEFARRAKERFKV